MADGWTTDAMKTSQAPGVEPPSQWSGGRNCGLSQAGTFTEPLTRTDAQYFTVTIFATVGFGDITAVTQTARVVTWCRCSWI